jgi:hypothetical protein
MVLGSLVVEYVLVVVGVFFRLSVEPKFCCFTRAKIRRTFT